MPKVDVETGEGRLARVRAMSPLDRLVYWIQERESVRLERDAGLPFLWTNDPILCRYRFCNVRRMDDKVSRWLLENWYTPYKDHPNMVLACVLARHFNLPSSLELIGFPVDWNPALVMKKLRKHKSGGNLIFNGAYMVRGIGTTDKTEMVVMRVCDPLVTNLPIIDPTSMQKSVEALLPYWGFSSFMAGQVVADLRWAMSGTWLDKFDWAPLGPGSQRGLNRLYGFVPKSSQRKEEFEGMLEDTINLLRSKVSPDLRQRLEAIDYQNCLCEWDKYERSLWGQGKPKQLYKCGCGCGCGGD